MSFELLVIGLHRVGTTAPPEAKIKGLFISPQLLDFELSLLEKLGFRFVTLQEAARQRSGKLAVITFDDGYRDVLTNGLPVLQKFGAPATIFVLTGDVGKKGVVWTESAEHLPADLLSWHELNFLRRKGWEISSHSHSHSYLSRRRAAEQKESIIQSIEEIGHYTGRKPVSFAYPYGDFQLATKKILDACGIKYAVTTEPAKSLTFSERTDLFELPRLFIGGGKARHFFKTLKRTGAVCGIPETLRGLVRSWKTGERHA